MKFVLSFFIFLVINSSSRAETCAASLQTPDQGPLLTGKPLAVRWVNDTSQPPNESTLNYRRYRHGKSSVFIPPEIFHHFVGNAGITLQLMDNDGTRFVLATNKEGVPTFDTPTAADYEGPRFQILLDHGLKTAVWREPLELENGFRLKRLASGRAQSGEDFSLQTIGKNYSTSSGEKIEVTYRVQVSVYETGSGLMNILDAHYDSVTQVGDRYRRFEIYSAARSLGVHSQIRWTESNTPPVRPLNNAEKNQNEVFGFQLQFRLNTFELESAFANSHRLSMPPDLSAIQPATIRQADGAQLLHPGYEGFRQMLNHILGREQFSIYSPLSRGMMTLLPPEQLTIRLVRLADKEFLISLDDVLTIR